MNKVCSFCKKELSVEEFYNQPGGGYQPRCKECVKESIRADRIRNPEKYSVRDKKRANNLTRLSQSEKHRIEWRSKHPERYRAQNAVNNAVRDKRLAKPNFCEVCGASCNPHAHHNDYSKPLLVIWVCAKCHRDLHHKA